VFALFSLLGEKAIGNERPLPLRDFAISSFVFALFSLPKERAIDYERLLPL
jgi:hypothetical protein